MRRAVFVLAAILAATPALAEIVVERPWARATPAGAAVGAAYLTLVNTGREPDRLVAAAVEGVPRVEIHETAQAGDVTTMRHVGHGLALPPGGRVTLEPGGHHLMLMGLTKPLTAGARLKARLTFERAGTVEVEVPVAPIGARGPAE